MVHSAESMTDMFPLKQKLISYECASHQRRKPLKSFFESLTTCEYKSLIINNYLSAAAAAAAAAEMAW